VSARSGVNVIILTRQSHPLVRRLWRVIAMLFVMIAATTE